MSSTHFLLPIWCSRVWPYLFFTCAYKVKGSIRPQLANDAEENIAYTFAFLLENVKAAANNTKNSGKTETKTTAQCIRKCVGKNAGLNCQRDTALTNKPFAICKANVLNRWEI